MENETNPTPKFESLADFRANGNTRIKKTERNSIFSPELRKLRTEGQRLMATGNKHLLTKEHRGALRTYVQICNAERRVQRQLETARKPIRVMIVVGAPATGKSTLLAKLGEMGVDAVRQDGDYIPAVQGVYAYNKARHGAGWWSRADMNQLLDISGMQQAWWTYFFGLDNSIYGTIPPGIKDKNTVVVVTAEMKAIECAMFYAKTHPGSRLVFSYVLLHPDAAAHETQMAQRVARNEPNYKTADNAHLADMRSKYWALFSFLIGCADHQRVRTMGSDISMIREFCENKSFFSA